MGEKFFVELVQSYGPFALGWVAFAVVSYVFWSAVKMHQKDYRALIDDYNKVVIAATAATLEHVRTNERLATLIEVQVGSKRRES